MIRLLLSCGLCISSTLSSLELHRQKMRSAEVSKDLADKTAEIIAALRFEAADVFELCETVFKGGTVCGYGEFLKIKSGDFPKLWQSACEGLKTDARSKALFSRAGRILGSCDLQSQTELLRELHKELNDHAKALRERAEASKKLYTTLGALLGAAVSIIII